MGTACWGDKAIERLSQDAAGTACTGAVPGQERAQRLTKRRFVNGVWSYAEASSQWRAAQAWRRAGRETPGAAQRLFCLFERAGRGSPGYVHLWALIRAASPSVGSHSHLALAAYIQCRPDALLDAASTDARLPCVRPRCPQLCTVKRAAGVTVEIGSICRACMYAWGVEVVLRPCLPCCSSSC